MHANFSDITVCPKSKATKGLKNIKQQLFVPIFKALCCNYIGICEQFINRPRTMFAYTVCSSASSEFIRE